MHVICLTRPFRFCFMCNLCMPIDLSLSSDKGNVHKANVLHLEDIMLPCQTRVCAVFSFLTRAWRRFPCKFVWLLNGTLIGNEGSVNVRTVNQYEL
jgi:hypothetical protein